jgi:hypothetical protein
MDKKTAMYILETPDEVLIASWEKDFENYRALPRKRKEKLLKITRRIANDVLSEQVTTFEMIDEKGRQYVYVEYLGEEEK